jgi:hypothetical protein
VPLVVGEFVASARHGVFLGRCRAARSDFENYC